MNNFNDKANFIWSIADLIRDVFKRGKYQDVILPFTVLRRIDCVLQPNKEKVLDTYNKFKGKLDNMHDLLCKASGFAFYNTSPFDFEKLLGDAPNLASNLRAYINGFSTNMREVLEKFDFDNTIKKLDDTGLLFKVMERLNSKDIDLHPDKVSNHEMGYIFEELIRKFNEALNENPGEHFTPREVIRLMVSLMLSQDYERIQQESVVLTVSDPCCGSGGMLTTAKERIEEKNASAKVFLFGQEVNPETFAMCKSDLYMKSEDGQDAEHIKFGSTLAKDQHANRRFDYQLANPPYGKEWKQDEEAVKGEYDKGSAGRFSAGLPRISDGQLLFLQHMLSRMINNESHPSRVGIVMNGSPLFTGDAGSGESEIRRWVLENDWLEAIVALPEQLFYNTGIATYIWVLSNRKQAQRQGKVQLINATGFWIPMRKSMGDKRRQISDGYIEQITALFKAYEESEVSKIFDRSAFGYRKITVERPLRLNFQASKARLELVKQQAAFGALAQSKKKDVAEKAKEEAAGRLLQAQILTTLSQLPPALYKDRAEFEKELDKSLKLHKLTLSAPIRKAVLAALSERDETAEICRNKDGEPEPDPELRDTENVPLTEAVEDFFEREVKPHVPDAWVNTTIRDPKDGQVGRVGYEINFNRYFYQYQPPRSLGEIEADIKQIEQDILQLLSEVAG
ncbi:class I SAM-dependent DNA methyltransferase [Candidatus Chlorohelix sp.]|uniref:type I restriction-modification system subunit M n=1 Tax=Candidatus Chlorohelix sp. TaxID=3139201 RepID=UPI003049FEC4